MQDNGGNIMKKITIVGAGLSGMVSAINLAKKGYEVTVLEKEKKIGGSAAFHPSLHATPIDVNHTSNFIGIDLKDHFPLLTDNQSWIKNVRLIPTEFNTHGVERGQRKSSLDNYLYKLCLELGVKFEFGHTVKKLADIAPGSIVASGALVAAASRLSFCRFLRWFFQNHTAVSSARFGRGTPAFPRQEHA